MSVGDKHVDCLFMRQIGKERSLVTATISVATGLTPWRIKLRDAAAGYAKGIGQVVMYAMPHLVHAEPGAWLIYRPGDPAPEFLKRMPTRESAEMWMWHGE